MRSRDYDAYTVKISRSEDHELKVSSTDKKRMETLNAITQELEKHQYTHLMLGITEEAITLELPNTVSDEEIQDINNIIQDVVEAKDEGPYSIKVKKIDMEKREQRRTMGRNP